MASDDALFARLALLRGWISRGVHDAALARLRELRARGLAKKTVEDVLREGGQLDEERLRVLRRLVSRFTKQARIGDYHILRRIGIGGTGMVFEARHRRLGRRVALKVLFPRLEREAGMAERFVREARILARIDHPSVIHAFDAGRDGAFCYIAMEMVDGENLAQILEREGPLPPGTCLATLLPVARALEAIHGAGLVHRDVKPANILIASSDGSIKLVDLGLFLGGVETPAESDGFVVGTPQFMAPEQVRGEADVDARSDLYSLGVTLYQALTGTLPFDCKDVRSLIRAHVETPAVAPGARNLAVPPELDRFVLRLLSKRPAERPESARVVVEQMEALQVELGLATSPPVGARPIPGGREPTAASPAMPEAAGAHSLRDLARELARPRVVATMACGMLLVAVVLAVFLRGLTDGPQTAPSGPETPTAEALPEPSARAVEPTAAEPAGDRAPAVSAPSATASTVSIEERRRSLVAALESTRVWVREMRDAMSRSTRVVGGAVAAALPLDSLSFGGSRTTTAVAQASASPPGDGNVVEKPVRVLPAAVGDGASAVRRRFVAQLHSHVGGAPVELLVRDGARTRMAAVRVRAGPTGGVSLVDVEPPERVFEVGDVHPVSVLVRGALAAAVASAPETEALTDGMAYAIAAGRPDWARRIAERLEIELPDGLSALAKAEFAGAEEDPTAANHLEWVLSIVRRALESERLLVAARWADAAAALRELSAGVAMPDALRSARELWASRAARVDRLERVSDAGGVFAGRVAFTSPLDSDEVDVHWAFESRAELDDFRFRPERWTVERGNLVFEGRAIDDRIDTVSIWRLPITISATWAVSPQPYSRVAIAFDDLVLGLGGPSGDVVLFRIGSSDGTRFVEGDSTGTGGAFRIRIERDRLTAELPDRVRLETALAAPMEGFGRVTVFAAAGSRLADLRITGIPEPRWLDARLAALAERDESPK